MQPPQMMTVSAAIANCDALPSCRAITYSGANDTSSKVSQFYSCRTASIQRLPSPFTLGWTSFGTHSIPPPPLLHFPSPPLPHHTSSTPPPLNFHYTAPRPRGLTHPSHSPHTRRSRLTSRMLPALTSREGGRALSSKRLSRRRRR